MRYLSDADERMLLHDDRNGMTMVSSLWIVDPSTVPTGELSFEDVVAYVHDRLHLAPVMRERLLRAPLGIDRPMWINDADFDLEYHVREVALPAPGGWKQFTTQVARLGARSLDLSRPPWELYIIRGLDSVPGIAPGSFAVMVRMHHAAVDANFGAQPVTALLQSWPGEAPAHPGRSWHPDSPPTPAESLAHGLVNAATMPIAAAQRLLATAVTLPRAIRRLGFAPAGAPPQVSTLTRFNRAITPHRVWDFLVLDFNTVRSVKAAAGTVTLNDVVVTIVGGGLRRYLTAHGDYLADSLTGLVPISVRQGQSEAQSASTLEDRVRMAQVPLGTHLADPVQRLAAISEVTAAARDYGASASSLVQTAENVPGALLGTTQRALVTAMRRPTRDHLAHLPVSNVPGPRTTMYFADAAVTAFLGMEPICEGMGLAIGIGAYRGDLSITWTADRVLMDDPGLLKDCLRQEYVALCEGFEVTPVFR